MKRASGEKRQLVRCAWARSEVMIRYHDEEWGVPVHIASRVENRRSGCSLPVVIGRGFRRVTSVRFGLVLFPVPAHRTGLAVFPHPALGKDSRVRPRMVRGPVW